MWRLSLEYTSKLDANSLCILKLFIAPLVLSAIGYIILFANFIVIVALSGFCIKKPETNNLLNKILF